MGSAPEATGTIKASATISATHSYHSSPITRRSAARRSYRATAPTSATAPHAAQRPRLRSPISPHCLHRVGMYAADLAISRWLAPAVGWRVAAPSLRRALTTGRRAGARAQIVQRHGQSCSACGLGGPVALLRVAQTCLQLGDELEALLVVASRNRFVGLVGLNERGAGLVAASLRALELGAQRGDAVLDEPEVGRRCRDAVVRVPHCRERRIHPPGQLASARGSLMAS